MKRLFALAFVTAAFAAQAEFMDRPGGIRIGQRMVIRPYVSVYYTYDSNVDQTKDANASHSIVVNPGATFAFLWDGLSIDGGAYYQYHAYMGGQKTSNNLNQHGYGEYVSAKWTDSMPGERGWTFLVREEFKKINQDDDFSEAGGRGMGRDRTQFDVIASLERRFTDQFHADVNGSFYYLDYDNDPSSYAELYGWNRWTVGAEIGYAASKWTDLLLTGNYQNYHQDNAGNSSRYSSHSQGWTVHGGLGSYATERLSYRVTGGYSAFYYAEGESDNGGFTYLASGNWKMQERWNMMLLATSYYQPSEREINTATRTDSVSWGLAHSMVRETLNATLDLSYRHQDRTYSTASDGEYREDLITARLGLNYNMNRYVGFFGRAEWCRNFAGGGNVRGDIYDYDRWRLTFGMRLTY